MSRQTKLGSLAETLANTASGWLLALFASFFIFPAIGVTMNADQNLKATALFTIVSVVRGYLWRRWFDKRAEVSQ